MNKYDEMSSFDIAVELKNYVKGSFSVYADHKKPFVLCEDTNEEFDPCNNLADMWGIILDNNIAISPRISQAGHSDHYKSWVKIDFDCDSYAGSGIWSDDFLVVSHENPLHAAAILFLMMKDAEK